jgi:hypothetical protein
MVSFAKEHDLGVTEPVKVAAEFHLLGIRNVLSSAAQQLYQLLCPDLADTLSRGERGTLNFL